MYQNTVYKKFLSDASAKIYAELLGKFMNTGSLNQSVEDNVSFYDHLSLHSVYAAERLAKKLEEFWKDSGDRSTVFFDVEDTVLSGIENGLAHINSTLYDLLDDGKL